MTLHLTPAASLSDRFPKANAVQFVEQFCAKALDDAGGMALGIDGHGPAGPSVAKDASPGLLPDDNSQVLAALAKSGGQAQFNVVTFKFHDKDLQTLSKGASDGAKPDTGMAFMVDKGRISDARVKVDPQTDVVVHREAGHYVLYAQDGKNHRMRRATDSERAKALASMEQLVAKQGASSEAGAVLEALKAAEPSTDVGQVGPHEGEGQVSSPSTGVSYAYQKGRISEAKIKLPSSSDLIVSRENGHYVLYAQDGPNHRLRKPTDEERASAAGTLEKLVAERGAYSKEGAVLEAFQAAVPSTDVGQVGPHEGEGQVSSPSTGVSYDFTKGRISEAKIKLPSSSDLIVSRENGHYVLYAQDGANHRLRKPTDEERASAAATLEKLVAERGSYSNEGAVLEAFQAAVPSTDVGQLGPHDGEGQVSSPSTGVSYAFTKGRISEAKIKLPSSSDLIVSRVNGHYVLYAQDGPNHRLRKPTDEERASAAGTLEKLAAERGAYSKEGAVLEAFQAAVPSSDVGQVGPGDGEGGRVSSQATGVSYAFKKGRISEAQVKLPSGGDVILQRENGHYVLYVQDGPNHRLRKPTDEERASAEVTLTKLVAERGTYSNEGAVLEALQSAMPATDVGQMGPR